MKRNVKILPVFIVLITFSLIIWVSCAVKGNKPGFSTINQSAGKDIYVSPSGSDSNSGSRDNPFLSVHRAVSILEPGSTLTLLEGVYQLDSMIVISIHADKDAWITVQGEAGANVILDGDKVNIPRSKGYPNNNGLIQIEDAAYIKIQNIHVRNSHRSGINIQESHHIDIINCTSENSLSPGIAAWQQCQYIRVLGNTVINANDSAMSWEPFKGSEAPHEAISMAGPHHFEVAWNHVYDCQKEGIDVKETASFGKVHHNYIHNCKRQGLYIDGWFGELQDIEMFENVVHDCEAGIAVSSEEGPDTRNLRIHHNLIYNNRATGIFFSRWGADNPRKDVEVYNNTFYQNGWGPAFEGNPQYWLTGGCYFYTTNIRDIIIRNNIFSRNFPFEIGHSGRFKTGWMEDKNIVIDYNLIHDVNVYNYPMYLETWLNDSVYSIKGTHAVLKEPLFVNPEEGDFRLQDNSPAIDAGHPGQKYTQTNGSRNDLGAFPAGTSAEAFWWKKDFPPLLGNAEND